MQPVKFGVGQAVRRIEDDALVRGAGHYIADHAPAGLRHAVMLRSPHAHASFRITDVATGDFTGDTIPDIAVTYNDATSHGRVAIMVNTGLGHGYVVKTLAFGQTTPFKSMALADFEQPVHAAVRTTLRGFVQVREEKFP